MAAKLQRTRFVCISDTHNASPVNGAFKLPKGDVLVHAGDLTNQGTLSELRRAVEWIEGADFKAKVVIAGIVVGCFTHETKQIDILKETMISLSMKNSTLNKARTSTINFLKVQRIVPACFEIPSPSPT